MRNQRHLEQASPGSSPLGRAGGAAVASPAELAAAVEVLLDELDSVAQRASRDGDLASVPVISIELASGETLHGVVVEYAAWQHTVVIRVNAGEVVRVRIGNIASVAVDLAAEPPHGWELVSGLVRVYR